MEKFTFYSVLANVVCSFVDRKVTEIHSVGRFGVRFCANAQVQQADKKLTDRITEQHPQIYLCVRLFLSFPRLPPASGSPRPGNLNRDTESDCDDL